MRAVKFISFLSNFLFLFPLIASTSGEGLSATCQLNIVGYPVSPSFSEHSVVAGDGHILYAEESGNPRGEPVIVMHGGPGIGAAASLKKFFDPSFYRIILVDQRATLRSRPLGSTENNTTQKLVDDYETVRKYLRIFQWNVFGGSWGSTLALLYAETYPERVKSLVLRGIFLANREANSYNRGIENQKRFSNEWNTFLSIIPVEHHRNIVPWLYESITSGDDNLVKTAARAHAYWENVLMNRPADINAIPTSSEITAMKIFLHYEYHSFFLSNPNQILENLNLVPKVPTFIVHGESDNVCPKEHAQLVASKLGDHVQFKLSPQTGHLATEPENFQFLLIATESLKKLFSIKP